MLQTDQSMHEYKLAKMKYSQIKIKQENSDSHVEIQFCQKHPQKQYFD